MTNWPLDAERELLADACRDNLELFVRVALGFTHPDNKKGRWWADDIHSPLCRWLQDQYTSWLAERHTRKPAERKYIAILIPRACAKSLLVTRASMTWLHLQDPNLSTFIGNEKLELAEEFLGTIKKWFEGTTDEQCLFNWLYGTWKGGDKRWRSDNITHGARTQERGEPSFGIWSPNSALTGRHPDILCMDDLVSYDALAKDLNWFESAFAHMTDLIPVVESNGLVILVGTRYSDADPFGRSFKLHGIKSIAGHTEFAEYQPRKGGRWEVYFLSGRTPDGEPAIPTVWTKDEMEAYEVTDSVKFASQVLNRPLAHKLRPLTEAQFDDQIIVERPRRGSIIFHLDTAFKSSKKMASGSETAFAASLHDDEQHGAVTFIDADSSISRNSLTFSELILDRYRYWTGLGYKVIGITDEAEMAGKSGLWGQFLSDAFVDAGLDFPAFYVFNRQLGEKKEMRINNAISFIIRRQVWFWKDMDGLDKLRYQLCNQPQAFPNDLADAFADAFNPEFFSGILPQWKAQKESYPYGAWEQRLKPKWFEKDDILDDDMDFDRPPIRSMRRGAPGSRASLGHNPFSEQGVAPRISHQLRLT